MSRYYFKKGYEQDDEVMCYSLSFLKKEMKENRITEMQVIEAELGKANGYFYCETYGETGETGEGCGKECPDYEPRNHKNGICKSYRNLYEPTDKVKTIRVKGESK